MVRTAFVLGAGLGTRLRPLTEVRPKPLIPVANRPLIEYAFDHLLEAGVARLVVNTHWLAHRFAELFPTPHYRHATLSFRHEPEVLETAGGIKNVEDLLGGEPFLVYNGDICTDLPLAPVLEHHRAAGNEVTLVLRSFGGPLQVQWDAATGRVVDVGGRLGHTAGPGFLFTGIYVVEPAFLARLNAGQKLSVVPVFCEMIRQGARLGGVVVDEGRWWDLGSREQYLAVHEHLPGAPWVQAPLPAVELHGPCAIGAGARVGAGSRLEHCLVWPGAQIAPGSHLTRCIVTGQKPVSGRHESCDL